MAANDVQIRIIGKDLASPAFKSANQAAAATTAEITALGRATSGLNQVFYSAAGFAAGIAGFNGLTAAIEGTVGAITSFKKSMEVHETGMAGILLSMTEINGRSLTWGESLSLSKDIMRQLNSEALRTAATTEELTTAFRGILGPALNAKMTISEILQLTSTGVNAIKSIMPANADMQRQLVQELRDLVAGGIQPASSTLATALGLKDKDIKAAKESTDGLFNFLMNRLKGFETSAPAYARTYQGIMDQIKEGFTLAGSQGTETLFAAMKEELASLAAQVVVFNQETGKMEVNPALVSAFQEISETVISAGKEVKSLARDISVVAVPAAQLLGTGLKLAAENAHSLTYAIGGWLVLRQVSVIMADVSAVTAGATAAQTFLGKAVLDTQSKYAQQAVVAAEAAAVERAAAGTVTIAQKGLTAAVGATTVAHAASGTAAAAASATTVTNMAVARTAVANLKNMVVALAGGWAGVAAVIGFATIKLIEHQQAKYKVESYNPETEVRNYDGRLHKRTITPTINPATGREYQKVDWKEFSQAEYAAHKNWQEENDPKKIKERQEKEQKENEEKIKKLYDELQAKFTVDSGNGTGSAKAAKAADRAYKEQERLKDKIADMIAKMDSKINNETATVFESSAAKLAAETDNMERELKKSKLDFAKYGIDVTDVYKKIGQYQDIMTAKIERQRSQALAGLITDTVAITAGISGNPQAVAEADYQKELTRIKKEREDDDLFKNTAKNKDDDEAREAANANYVAQEAAALKKRNDSYREAVLQRYDWELQYNNNLVDLGLMTTDQLDQLNSQKLTSEIAYLQNALSEVEQYSKDYYEIHNQLAQKVQQRNEIMSRDMVAAVGIALDDIKNQQFDFADMYTGTWSDIDNAVNEHFKSMLKGNESLGTGIKDTIGDIASAVSDMFADILYQTYIMQPLKDWFTGLLAGIGGQGTGTSSSSQSAVNLANFGSSLSVLNGVKFYAEGGVASGWSVVGEKGPELVNFSNPSRVYTADQTRQALSNNRDGDIINANLVFPNVTKPKEVQQFRHSRRSVARQGYNLVQRGVR